MLDRYRPTQSTAPEDAARTAWLAAEHDRARDRFLAAERRKRTVAIVLLCVALGGGAYFFFQQWQNNAAILTPARTGKTKAAPGKDLVDHGAVREAVLGALRTRGVGGKPGERVILSDGQERRELDLRPPEKRREPPPK